jgi:hypothetical protein
MRLGKLAHDGNRPIVDDSDSLLSIIVVVDVVVDVADVVVSVGTKALLNVVVEDDDDGVEKNMGLDCSLESIHRSTTVEDGVCIGVKATNGRDQIQPKRMNGYHNDMLKMRVL